MKPTRSLQSVLLATLILLAGALPAGAAYLPLWVLQEKVDYVLDATNLGYRMYMVADTAKVQACAVTVHEILYRNPKSNAPDVAPGDSVLMLIRGNYLKDDRERYILFALKEQRRNYTGLPMPLFEGQTVPCGRWVPIFSREEDACGLGTGRSCDCVIETARKHRELDAARARGEEETYLRGLLHEKNTVTLLSAMGLLRLAGDPESINFMEHLVTHPDMQVRYDLAESIPYIPGSAASRIGVKLLDDTDPRVELFAAWGLGRIRSEEGASAMAAVLEDPERPRDVRAICLYGLEGMNSPLLLPALEKGVAADGDAPEGKGFREHLDRLRKKAAQEK